MLIALGVEFHIYLYVTKINNGKRVLIQMLGDVIYTSLFFHRILQEPLICTSEERFLTSSQVFYKLNNEAYEEKYHH